MCVRIENCEPRSRVRVRVRVRVTVKVKVRVRVRVRARPGELPPRADHFLAFVHAMHLGKLRTSRCSCVGVRVGGCGPIRSGFQSWNDHN